MFLKGSARLQCYLSDDSGATAVEYAVITTTMGLMLIPFIPDIIAILQACLETLAANMN
jgi:Flp pilus assembly pilin Flp